MATTVIPMHTSSIDHSRYFVDVMPCWSTHCPEPNGLYMFMKMIANIDTKSTIIMRLRFSTRYRGIFLKSIEVYSNIEVFAVANIVAKLGKYIVPRNVAGRNIVLKFPACAFVMGCGNKYAL